MKLTKMPPFPPGENPFLHDWYHMGQTFGTNLVLMFANHATAKCNYIILVNTETGERHKVSIDD